MAPLIRPRPLKPLPPVREPKRFVPARLLVVIAAGAVRIMAHDDRDKAGKVTIRFKPVGSTKKVKTPVISVAGNQRFGSLVNFLRRQLGAEAGQSLFCYINASFSPQLDMDLGTLAESYAVDKILNVSYCNTVAFG